MNLKTSLLLGLAVLGFAAAADAQTSRGQSYALNCIGFSGGYTKALATGFISTPGGVYSFNATCNSTQWGGASQSTFPVIPPTGGSVDSIMIVVRTESIASWGNKIETATFIAGNGFVVGEPMADIDHASGESHLMISVNNPH